MTASKSPRQQALNGLKRLSSDRVNKEAELREVFFWLGADLDPAQDRPAAITAATVVEHGLEYALLTLMHRRGPETRDRLFEGDAAILRDFSAKTTLAHAMGILGDNSRSDISLIRQIRNTFAHCRHPIGFETPEIAAACEHISVIRRLVERGQASAKERHPRETYLQTCFEFSVWLFTFDEPRPEGSTPHPPRRQLQL